MPDDAMIEAPTKTDVEALIKGKFGSKVVFRQTTKKNSKADNEGRRLYMDTDRDTLYELCQYVHDRLNFEHIISVTAVDWVDHMQTVYHIMNYLTGMVVEITADIPNDDPHIRSVTDIWEGANWHEREAYELFGIIFDNHPKLERLLTPKSYEFYPFRKSYKLRGQPDE